MWQIEQTSTGLPLSNGFYDSAYCQKLIELIAHWTGIDIDDIDATYFI